MTEILKKIYSELWGGDTSLLIWTLVGFLFIVFISRRIGKLKELKNRDKLLFMIDIVLFPSMILLFYLISLNILESDTYSISLSLTLLCLTWFFNRFLGLYYWSNKFVEKSGTDTKILDNYLQNVEVVVWTPGSSKGIPLCINPLNFEGLEVCGDLPSRFISPSVHVRL